MGKGDLIKVEIRDCNYRVLLRGKYNLNDREEIRRLLSMIEKFCGYNLSHIISVREWI